MLSFGLRPACRRRAPRTGAAGRESARPGSTAVRTVIAVQLSKSDAGLRALPKPVETSRAMPSLQASQSDCHRRVPPSQGNIEAGCPACSSILLGWVAPGRIRRWCYAAGRFRVRSHRCGAPAVDRRAAPLPAVVVYSPFIIYNSGVTPPPKSVNFCQLL